MYFVDERMLGGDHLPLEQVAIFARILTDITGVVCVAADCAPVGQEAPFSQEDWELALEQFCREVEPV